MKTEDINQWTGVQNKNGYSGKQRLINYELKKLNKNTIIQQNMETYVGSQILCWSYLY